jgi:hypothetical protein
MPTINLSFSSGQTKSAPHRGQSEVEAEEGFVTLKEFQFDRNFE